MAQGKYKAHKPVPGTGKKNKGHKKAITIKKGCKYLI